MLNHLVRRSAVLSHRRALGTLATAESSRWMSSNRKFTRRYDYGEETHTTKEEMKHINDKHKPVRNERDTVMCISLTPVGLPLEDTSLSRYVAIAARVAQRMEVKHETHALGITIEETLDKCFDVAKEIVSVSLKRTPRCKLEISADIRPGHENRLQKKHKKILSVDTVVEST